MNNNINTYQLYMNNKKDFLSISTYLLYLEHKNNNKTDFTDYYVRYVNESFDYNMIGGKTIIESSNKLTKSFLDTNRFYIVHSTLNADSLKNILIDGYLRAGKDVKHEHILAEENLKYIYANINFNSLNNIDTIGGYKLFFHPSLVFDYNVVFNEGWQKYPTKDSIIIKKNYTIEKKIKLLRKIKKYLKNPTFYPQKLIDKAGYRTHEILFNKPISLKKYLIGVEFEEDPNNENYKTDHTFIKDILNKKYPHTVLVEIPRNDEGLVEPPKLLELLTNYNK